MKKLLLITLLSVASICRAQTVSKSVDPFNGKQLKSASATIGGIIAPFAGMTINFNYNGDKKYISFTWKSGSAVMGSLSEKTKDVSLLFKLENDSVYRFKADTIYGQVSNSANTSVTVVRAKITDKEIYAFAVSPIAKFRIATKEDNGIDLDDRRLLTYKNKKQVQKAAAYMLDMQILAEDNDQ